ncbi:MAG TPA: RluA family pseudouridine synthase [Gaiellaceae bacterium]|jgi:23S rRNA pseudouridine1911/1915/1917 synthase|nr:RluA family pseudouridine synthase [Gaiellaceae bacterium]
MRLVVPPEAAGERLDRFLASCEAVGSRAAAERLLRSGAVLVDGATKAKSHRLSGGEGLELELPERREATFEPEPVEGLRIAFEDEQFLVVDKPVGVVVHPAAGHRSGTLVHGLLAHAIRGGDAPERPGIVHRLDRDTSGLLVVARSDEAHRRLQRLLRRRELTREYLALARGRPRSRAGRIEAPIGRDRRDPTRVSLDTAAPREAITTFELAELLPEHALLRARLETGRTHQIRVHLGAIGLPVSGDPVYGVAGDLGLERQFLHAARLAFPHPFGGADVDVDSPLPPDLARALDVARTGDAGTTDGD